MEHIKWFLKQFLTTIIYLLLFIIIFYCFINFWGIDKIKGINREAIFAALITIFVFGVGLFVKVLQDKIKQILKDKQLKKIFICNLNTIIDGLKLQLNNLNLAIETLKSINAENVLISSYIELEYFEIKNISTEDLYRIFIDNLDGKEKSKIDTLENLRKQLLFVEISNKNSYSEFERLYHSFRNDADGAILGMRN